MTVSRDGRRILYAQIDLEESDLMLVDDYIPLGQRVAAFEVKARLAGQWRKLAPAQTIGPRRTLRTHRVRADHPRVTLTKFLACPALSTIEPYHSPR